MEMKGLCRWVAAVFGFRMGGVLGFGWAVFWVSVWPARAAGVLPLLFGFGGVFGFAPGLDFRSRLPTKADFLR